VILISTIESNRVKQTRELIERSDQFSVNIALIYQTRTFWSLVILVTTGRNTAAELNSPPTFQALCGL